MIAGLRDRVSSIRVSSFVSRGAALVVPTVLIVLLSPLASVAQDAGAAPSPMADTTTETAPSSQAPLAATPDPAADRAGSASRPSDATADTQPAATPVPAAMEASEAAAPSTLDDPAEAVPQVIEPAGSDPTLPHDLSPWGMFMAADRVVKAVMIGLAFASLMTWTIWLAKSVEILCAKARAGRALADIARASSIKTAADALSRRGGPAAFMVRMAQGEMARSEEVLDHAGNQGLTTRVLSHLVRIEAQAGRRLMRGTGILATIGSTAPFVGLFGTVWGIMNAFIGISEAQTTNLAIVAPGIAEALLATAIGLVAAIPAVVFYNVFARSIAGYKQLLADASAAVERLVSLDLDRRKVPAGAARPALAAE
jgi:biopolymer transport protein ExbB